MFGPIIVYSTGVSHNLKYLMSVYESLTAHFYGVVSKSSHTKLYLRESIRIFKRFFIKHTLVLAYDSFSNLVLVQFE